MPHPFQLRLPLDPREEEPALPPQVIVELREIAAALLLQVVHDEELKEDGDDHTS